MRARFRAFGLLALSWLVACAPGLVDRYRPPTWPQADQVRLSLLAVGDTGKPPFLTRWFHKELAVGAGLAAEDRHLPVDALVLLGDNFYWQGLQRAQLVERLRVNVVRPFCRFVSLRAARSAEVRDACKAPEELRHPIPLYAVLGNHDYRSPESPELQRRAIPQFVANWRMSDRLATAVEFPEGLSLVLFDSVALRNGADRLPLRKALSQGERTWRILAAHHPIASVRDHSGAAASQRRYIEQVLRSIEEAEVPVHLFLSGHEHNLQVVSMSRPAPPLHIVSGSGSRFRALRTSNPDTRFALSKLGFVRIDLVGSGPEQRLVVSLFSTPTYPIFSTRSRRLVSRWAVTRDGEVREVPPLARQVRRAPPTPAVSLAGR